MADTTRERVQALYGKVIARAWRDPAFKARLLSDPHGALQEAGVGVRAGLTVKVVEDTGKHVHLVLPAKPAGELSDEALDKLAGGSINPPGGNQFQPIIAPPPAPTGLPKR